MFQKTNTCRSVRCEKMSMSMSMCRSYSSMDPHHLYVKTGILWIILTRCISSCRSTLSSRVRFEKFLSTDMWRWEKLIFFASNRRTAAVVRFKIQSISTVTQSQRLKKKPFQTSQTIPAAPSTLNPRADFIPNNYRFTYKLLMKLIALELLS